MYSLRSPPRGGGWGSPGNGLYAHLDAVHARTLDAMRQHVQAAWRGLETLGAAVIAVLAAILALLAVTIGTIFLEFGRFLQAAREWMRETLRWFARYLAFGSPLVVALVAFPTIVGIYGVDPPTLFIALVLLFMPIIVVTVLRRGDPGAALVAGFITAAIAVLFIYVPMLYQQLVVMGIMACNMSYLLHVSPPNTSHHDSPPPPSTSSPFDSFPTP